VGKNGDYSSGTVRDLHPIPFSCTLIANEAHTIDDANIV